MNKKLREGKSNSLSVEPDDQACPQCSKNMSVFKTYSRPLVSLKLGRLTLRVKVLICKNGCKTPNGKLPLRYPETLSKRTRKKGRYGYDIEVYVGIRRWLMYRQRTEIQEELQEKHGITISTGKISELSRDFLKHIKILHEMKSPDLRKALEEDGGYPLNVDATGESGAGTLFMAIAGWRKWVLGAWKLTTECSDQIEPCLEEIAKKFGAPISVMRDYGRAMIPAVKKFVSSTPQNVRILGCHQHFCGFVGKDLLEKSYKELGTQLSKYGFKTRLRSMVRDWGSRSGVQEKGVREYIERWCESTKFQIPSGSKGIAILRSCVQWVLDAQAETKNLRFPFALPHLHFYDRCLLLRRSCDSYLNGKTGDTRIVESLERLKNVLNPIVEDENFLRITTGLRKKKKLFDELRATIRIQHDLSGVKPSKSESSEKRRSELNDIGSALTNLKKTLHEKSLNPVTNSETKEGAKTILKQLERHEDSLSGHIVTLPKEIGGGYRLIERTNIDAEGFFNVYKQGERRRSGRKNLSQDLEHIPPESALVKNLNHPDYVQILCGTIENLSEIFADLDREYPTAINNFELNKQKGNVETASLSQADKIFVRNEFLGEKISKAAAC